MNRKLVFALVVLMACGCSSSELSRGKAKDIIQASDKFQSKKQLVYLAPEEVADCIKQGYLVWYSGFVQRLQVTEKGKQFFESATGEAMGGLQTQPSGVTPIVPMRLKVIEVTGLRDGEKGSKIAEFTYQYDTKGVPRELQNLIFKQNPIDKGKADLALYDDGWRFVKFE